MLDIKDLFFSYDKEPVLENISFSVPQGNHVSVIGESGCGKSTLLKLVYGLYDTDSGEIIFNGRYVRGPKYNLIPGADEMKYLAQDFGLMPYITVSENVGKYLSNIYKEKKQQRIRELLETVGMLEYADVKAQFLSGGQQQRVALARVLALEPKVLLLDEPFSQVDNFRANTLRRKLFGYLKQQNITCVIATHDSSDVLSFSDDVIVMRNGKIIAQGNPAALYNNPADIYVASLFGEANEIPARLIDGRNSIENLIIYPHQLRLTEKSLLKAEVVNSFFKGDYYLIEVLSEGSSIFFSHLKSIEKDSIVFLEATSDAVR
ncbi:MAG TPA: ABC transporter ATP-binding protein [Flavobacterium sp.]|jgi:ABC-type Fe3+/spermidine/putrescine transport system ATPase subunit